MPEDDKRSRCEDDNDPGQANSTALWRRRAVHQTSPSKIWPCSTKRVDERETNFLPVALESSMTQNKGDGKDKSQSHLMWLVTKEIGEINQSVDCA